MTDEAFEAQNDEPETDGESGLETEEESGLETEEGSELETDQGSGQETDQGSELETDQGSELDTDDVSELDTDDEDEAEDEAAPAGRPSRLERLEHEGDIAADYLEELLDIADLDGDLDMDVDGDRAAVSIVGADLSQLVGARGEVLDALQELTRLAVYRETGERSRLMLDIGGYRADKKTSLEKLAAETVAQVKETGQPVSLEPMSPFERKVVHDVVAAAGLTSESAGIEPRRYVVVQPA